MVIRDMIAKSLCFYNQNVRLSLTSDRRMYQKARLCRSAAELGSHYLDKFKILNAP